MTDIFKKIEHANSLTGQDLMTILLEYGRITKNPNYTPNTLIQLLPFINQIDWDYIFETIVKANNKSILNVYDKSGMLLKRIIQ